MDGPKLNARLGLDTKEFDRKLKDANGSVSTFAGKLGGLGAIAGIGGLATAFTLIKKGIDSSGEASDKLSFAIAGVNGAIVAMGQNLISLDFSRSFIDAFHAARDLAETMDDINDQALSLNILDSQHAIQIAKLRNDLKDTSLSTTVRLGKEKEIQNIIDKELAARTEITNQQLAAVNASDATKYGITTKEANLYLDYITNYATLTEEQRKQLKLALELNKVELEQKRNSGKLGQLDVARTQHLRDVREAAAALPDELKKYLPIANIINDYTDKQKQALGEIIIGYNRANLTLIKQSGFADRIADKLTDQKGSTAKIGDNLREALDVYKLWDSQIHVAGNQPVGPSAVKLDPTQLAGVPKIESEIGEKTVTVTEAVNEMGNAFNNLGSSIDGVAGSWISYIGNVVSTIPKLLEYQAQIIAANAAQATSAGVTAAAEGAKSVAGVPYVGPILAVAAIATIMGALLSMPKLANGGLAYGPTSAVIGEYPGASSNPEVISPLSKLKDAIGDTGGTVHLTAKLKGRDIYLSGTRYSNSLNKNS